LRNICDCSAVGVWALVAGATAAIKHATSVASQEKWPGKLALLIKDRFVVFPPRAEVTQFTQ